MSNILQFPIIAGVEITTDAEGRFNLNALHRAHLELNVGIHRNSKQPADWLKLEGTKELIAAVSNSEDLHSCPIESKPGRYGGTFAHELLAVSYAGWISPRFQLLVNQTFIDHKAGTLERCIPQSLPEALRLAADQAEQLEAQQEKIAQDAPKVDFHDQVTATEGAISVGEAAKILGTGRARLFSFLRHHGWVTRGNEPYQSKIEAGYMDVKLNSFEHPVNGLQKSITALVTGKGLAKLQTMHCKVAS